MKEMDTSSFAALEHSGWSDPETARSYARGFAEAAEHCVPALVRASGAAPGRAILDMCCGHGNVTRGLEEAGTNVTGLDFSPAMLEMAREAAPTAEFVEGDAMALPFADGSFDGITIGFGILHVPDPFRALTEARRVLRPGGRLAYSVWHAPTIPSGLGYVFAAIAAHGDPNVKLPEGPGLHDYADPEIAWPQLAAAGFRQMQLEVVDCYWLADRPDAPVEHFLHGTVRGGALLRAQPAENLERIRAAVRADVLASHGSSAPWRIPIPAALVSAVAEADSG